MTQIYIQVQGGFVYALTRRILRTQQDASLYLTEFGVTPDNAPSTRRTFKQGDYEFTLSHTLDEIFSDDELKPSQLVADMMPSLGVNNCMTPTTASPTSSKPNKTRADLHQSYKDALNVDDDSQLSLPGIPPAGPVVTFKGDVVPLKEICQHLRMEPRTARQKLRKLAPDNGKQRWEWTPNEATKIMQLLNAK